MMHGQTEIKFTGSIAALVPLLYITLASHVSDILLVYGTPI